MRNYYKQITKEEMFQFFIFEAATMKFKIKVSFKIINFKFLVGRILTLSTLFQHLNFENKNLLVFKRE
jgi:hypothetical protein